MKKKKTKKTPKPSTSKPPKRTGRSTQISDWLKGTSIHGKGKNAECVPDFSCCRPDLLARPEERQAFVDATPAVRAEIRAVFIGIAGASYDPDKGAYVPSKASK